MSEKPAVSKRTEFSIKVPANTGLKRFSILKFNGSLNVDPLNSTEQLSLEREDNRSHVFATESKQYFGEGSEYGKAARDEARRKHYGR